MKASNMMELIMRSFTDLDSSFLSLNYRVDYNQEDSSFCLPTL